ncbi:TPA: hypothetical protein ACVT6Z_003924 [Clostridioides difficile]
MKDIFSEMQASIGCTYISDLPHHRRMVWQEMKQLHLADYPQKQLEDFAGYVFGVPYPIIAEALQKGRENL